MNRSITIGVKYVAVGIVSFAASVFILARIMNQAVSVGVGVAVMASMVMYAAQEAYAAGKKDSAKSSEE